MSDPSWQTLLHYLYHAGQREDASIDVHCMIMCAGLGLG